MDNKQAQDVKEIKAKTTKSAHNIRNKFRFLSNFISKVPGISSRERTLAIENLEQAEMWAVKGVYANTGAILSEKRNDDAPEVKQ